MPGRSPPAWEGQGKGKQATQAGTLKQAAVTRPESCLRVLERVLGSLLDLCILVVC